MVYIGIVIGILILSTILVSLFMKGACRKEINDLTENEKNKD